MMHKSLGSTVEERGQPGVLALADGTIFRGTAFGAEKPLDKAVVAEVVFNTSMYGYQEILTDPSYAGQTLCFTYPHIGNVGCNDEDNESAKVYAEALIIRDLTKVTSNFRATMSLPHYLRKWDRMGLYGIDTRALVAHLRDKGSQMGALASGSAIDVAALVDKARAQGSMAGKDYVQYVSCKKTYTWNELPWTLPTASNEGGYRTLSEEQLSARPHVVAIDCGIKYNILRLLIDSGFRLTVAPATSTAPEIEALKPDALFLSNGPGDPATLHYVVDPVRELVGKYPIFGICLGHQVLAQALGGSTYKLKFGHRGGNHPVKDFTTGKVEITVQNHGFAVDKESLPKSARVAISHINLNDQTVEGLHAPELKAFSIQYHPEASPGPHDARYLFRRFFENVVTTQR